MKKSFESEPNMGKGGRREFLVEEKGLLDKFPRAKDAAKAFLLATMIVLPGIPSNVFGEDKKAGLEIEKVDKKKGLDALCAKVVRFLMNMPDSSEAIDDVENEAVQYQAARQTIIEFALWRKIYNGEYPRLFSVEDLESALQDLSDEAEMVAAKYRERKKHGDIEESDNRGMERFDQGIWGNVGMRALDDMIRQFLPVSGKTPPREGI